jgi:hypothetical protein
VLRVDARVRVDLERVVVVGRILEQRFLDAYFITALYKMILKKKIALADMESVDAEMYSSAPG